MKTRIISILCLFAVAIPLHSIAQTNVRKAFEKLLGSSDVVYTESHSMEKDPQTRVKESQEDIYNFTLPTSKINLVDNILKAFQADEAMAYNTSNGKTGPGDPIVSLAVGNGNKGTAITCDGRNYVYSCFLAPEKEDPFGIHRYAYGMNWEEKDGKITGTLLVTYATTLKHRQSNNPRISYRIVNGNIVPEESIDSWFEKFMGYVQAMATENIKARQALASKIYEHTKSSSHISKEDKNTAREILKGMISDKKYDDPIISQLLNASLINIK